MMSRLLLALVVVTLFIVQPFSTARAQDQNTDVTLLQERVDSLSALKEQLMRQLSSVDTALNESEALLHLHQAEHIEAERVVLFTNMEASLRSMPSPEGRVIRILPQKTPLVATDFQGAYWKVRHQGIEGWVMRLFVDEGEDAMALKQQLISAEGSDTGKVYAAGATKQVEERLGKTFLVTDFGVHPPNSAGGISIYYAFEHLDSTRTVREVTFSITPFNADGAIEKGMNSGASTKRLRRFGPINVHDGERQYQFENVWYNGQIRCAEIDRIDIVYTDGSRVSHRLNINDILAGNIKNDCTLTTADQLMIQPDNE